METLEKITKQDHITKQAKFEFAKENIKCSIEITVKNTEITFLIEEKESIPADKFETKFSKEDLNKLAKYFLMFDNLEECFNEFEKFIKQNDYELKKDKNIIMLNFKTGIQNKNIELEIPLIKKNIEEVVNELSLVIKQQKKEIEELKKIQSVQEYQKVLKELNELKVSVYNSGFYNAYEASFIGSTILDERNKFILSHLIKKMYFKKYYKSLDDYERMEKRKIMSKLLYKASVDGDNYKIFHQKCDNQGETVTIIKSEQNKIFGIFSNVNWDINNKKKTNWSEPAAYLYSLEMRDYYSSSKVYPSFKDYGPNLADDHDSFYFYVSNLCLHNNNSYICNEYKVMNNGVNNFKIIDYEVFSIMVF